MFGTKKKIKNISYSVAIFVVVFGKSYSHAVKDEVKSFDKSEKNHFELLDYDSDRFEEIKTEIINNDKRINGGQIVKHVVPYQISMQMKRRGQWRHFCSGSIISASYVLTAAHCVDKIRNIREISLVAGTLAWKPVGGDTGGDRHMLVAKHVHPNFAMEPQIVNDIAIVQVTPPFKLNRHTIGAISLGSSSRIGDKVAVRVTGWGSTAPTLTSTQDLPANLQSLDYYTISNEVCRRRGFNVTSHELCALAPKGKGACMGDSGGPLVTVNGKAHLVGIVSYGSSMCAQGRPDVYTRVSSFLPYIHKVIAKELT